MVLLTNLSAVVVRQLTKTLSKLLQNESNEPIRLLDHDVMTTNLAKDPSATPRVIECTQRKATPKRRSTHTPVPSPRKNNKYGRRKRILLPQLHLLRMEIGVPLSPFILQLLRRNVNPQSTLWPGTLLSLQSLCCPCAPLWITR